MSIGLKMTFGDIGEISRMNNRLADLARPQMRDLMENIGSEVEAQTRTRINDEKEAPDGSEWADWSKAYAGSDHGAKNHAAHSGSLRASGGHSMLQLSGELLDSITSESKGSNQTLVGSNMVYARKVNKQRQFLGLSTQNRSDIENLVVDFLEAAFL